MPVKQLDTDRKTLDKTKVVIKAFITQQSYTAKVLGVMNYMIFFASTVFSFSFYLKYKPSA
jgi:hypothetical protein